MAGPEDDCDPDPGLPVSPDDESANGLPQCLQRALRPTSESSIEYDRSSEGIAPKRQASRVLPIMVATCPNGRGRRSDHRHGARPSGCVALWDDVKLDSCDAEAQDAGPVKLPAATKACR